MSANSAIEWTTHTFNPWWGCTKVHQGCKNCYAETLDHRWGGDHWGPSNPRRMVLGEWSKPAQWDKAAKAAGERHRVFCASMCDLFEDLDRDHPVFDQQDKPVEMAHHAGRFWTIPDLRARVFQIIEETPNLLWLLLTKRPENITRMVPPGWLTRWPDNVMTGTSPCDQETADKCIPHLIDVPGSHFLSVEPMLGPVDLSDFGGIDWVICGGESGPGARPMDPKWARSLRDQCVGAGVPFHFKQWGGVNKKATGRVLDGRTWDEVPT